MIQFIGTVIVLIGISGLFVLARDGSRPSKTLWIPVIWFFLAASRPISLWLHIQQIGSGVDDQLEGSPIDRNVFTALIVIAISVLAVRGPRVAALLRSNGPLVLFLLYCGLSIVWSDFPDVAFKRWIRAVGDIVMVLVIFTAPSPSTAVKGFLAWASFIVVPLGILFDLGRGYSGLGYHVGLTISNKNLYGAVSMILALGAVWRFQTVFRGESKGRTRRLLAHGSIAAMAIWSTWWSNSGTAKACFLLGVFPIVVMTRWSLARKPVVVHAVVASLVFMALYASIINPDAGVVSAMGKDPTLTGRTEVWSTVLRMNPNPLLGAGFESFWLGSRLKALWNIFVWHPNEAHNGYLETYLNLGWVGVILLALVIVKGYRTVVNGFRQDRNAGSLWLAYFLVVIVYNLTEAGFRIFSPTWIAFVLSISKGFALKREKSITQSATAVQWDYSETRA
jgi:exopolysaccharide production protein ExoQ